jgi:hypothetical protein
MTATTTMTYLVAHEHINDLRRDAERNRLAAQIRPRRRMHLPIPRIVGRRATRTSTA